MDTVVCHKMLAVDPGKEMSGVAYFEDGVLKRCSLVRAAGPFEVARAVAVWHGGIQVDDLVVENQRIYPGPRRSDPNDLLPLAQVVGGVFARIPALNRYNPMPQEWKGSMKKDLFTARIRAGLSAAEQRLLSSAKVAKSLEHNVLDAIALGKWLHVRLHRSP